MVRPYWQIQTDRHERNDFLIGAVITVVGWLFVLVCALVGLS
jgi:hypothetical protein